MRKIKYLIFSTILTSLLLPSCKLKTPEAVKQRQEWLLSLNDSITAFEQKKAEVESLLKDARERVGLMLADFDYVNDPRQVEGYYIFKGWKNRYPLQTSGVVARVTEDERYELIATLTGAHFNEIGVTSGNQTVSSEVVPHDQALNYRAGNLNIVCFSGNKADSIGQFISAHSMDPLTVIYLNGSKTGSINLPSDEKQMVARTWELYNAQRGLHRLEKELPRLSGKIAACRRLIESADSTTVQ